MGPFVQREITPSAQAKLDAWEAHLKKVLREAREKRDAATLAEADQFKARQERGLKVGDKCSGCGAEATALDFWVFPICGTCLSQQKEQLGRLLWGSFVHFRYGGQR